MLKSIIVIASLAASSAVFAAPSRLTDSQFLEATRCRVLIASPALGAGDTKPIDATVQAEGRGRIAEVEDRADSVRDATLASVRHADSDGKAKLMAERNGVCQVLAGAAPSNSGSSAQSSGAN
jgi:hypothetical protein